MAAFAEICAYARRAGLLVIADGKRGDIGSTARAYAAAYLAGDEPVADALTVNPWLGRESVEPYLAAARRYGTGFFCVVKTSNAGGDIQDVTLSDGRPMWHHVAAQVAEWGADVVGENGLSAVGAVVGATHPRAVGEARKLMPQAVLLLPGVGAQGATPGRPRPRVHERPGERARQRLALGHLRLPRDRRGLPRRGRRRGGAAAAGDLGGVRLVAVTGRPWRSYAAPVAFLLAATLAVVAPARRAPRRRARRDDAAGADDARRGASRRQTPRALHASAPATRSRRSRRRPASRSRGSQQLNPNVEPTSLFIGDRIRLR